MTTAAVQPSGPYRRSRPRRRPPALSPERAAQPVTLTLLTSIVAIYSLIPLVWLVINATKTAGGPAQLVRACGSTTGKFALWDNIRRPSRYDDGVFVRWLRQHPAVRGGRRRRRDVPGHPGGYGLAKFDFVGPRGSSPS
jgi:multiple sugar transport system permease protein